MNAMPSTVAKPTAPKRRSESKQKLKLQQSRQQKPAQQNGKNAPLTPQERAGLEKLVDTIQNGSNVLEAIDKLRLRKARPSSNRICNYMLRKFSVDAAHSIDSLTDLLCYEAAFEVDYKGSASYRNALNWAKMKSYKKKPEFIAKRKFNIMALEKAFFDLYLSEPDYVDQGVPPTMLIDKLLDAKNPSAILKNAAAKYLAREVKNGYLVQRINNNYSLANPPKENGETDLKSLTSINLSGTSNTNGINGSPDKMCDADGNGMDVDPDSGSNSVKHSLETCIKTDIDQMKNEDYYEIIVGRNLVSENGCVKKESDDIPNNISVKEESVKLNGKLSENREREETKNNGMQQLNRKKLKAERKQRLCVRSDDSMDLIFNDQKEIHYKDENNENDRISDEAECDQVAGGSSTNVSPTPSQANGGGFRSARRKTARKVFDPSDNMIVKRKRGRQSNALKAAIAVAQQDAHEHTKSTNGKEKSLRQCNECSKDKEEALMACRDCTVRVHPSCVYTQEEIVLKAHTSWQCDDCKTCITCFETRSFGPIITCFHCNDSYHYACHNPKVSSSKNKWFCCKCNSKQEKLFKNTNASKERIEQQVTNNANGALEIIKLPESKERNNIEEDQAAPIDDDGPDIDENIPDTSNWCEDQVYRYFARLFPTNADVFRNEKIDGTALQLLTRSDVLRRFQSVSFGTKIKMWNQIVILQKRRNYVWDYWK